MASKQEVELFISEEGELKVHIKGIKGAGCFKVLEQISKEIGILKEKETSSEYYESVEHKNVNNNKIRKKTQE